ncbi:MAG: Mov34/MPN/PAD-1 family protein [Nitrospirae bacterium]|nr:Mov34/MPN/PAD-1 family protein [Nitrospirota bacterium]MBF0540595.1 Mov34/MPN/PAD-1 family protein [Nitrospirota bacterium]
MRINNDILDEMFQYAIDKYPEECCGIVSGKGDIQRVHFCVNIQNKLHQEDPESNPRDAKTAYQIDRSEAERIFASIKVEQEEIIAFFHSHIEHEAYFSDIDVAAQTVFGEPEFPNALHIVISVKKRKISDMKCFKWDKETKDFITVVSFDRV